MRRRTSSSLTLAWRAPLKPHGDVTHYVLRWRRHVIDRREYALKDYCRDPLMVLKMQQALKPGFFSPVFNSGVVSSFRLDGTDLNISGASRLKDLVSHERESREGLCPAQCCQCDRIDKLLQGSVSTKPSTTCAPAKYRYEFF